MSITMDSDPPPRFFDKCHLCRNSPEPGWLCSMHHGMPWEHDSCGAEGSPCICNPSGAVRGGKVIAEFVDRRTLH